MTIIMAMCTIIFINSESCLQHQPESYVVNLPYRPQTFTGNTITVSSIDVLTYKLFVHHG